MPTRWTDLAGPTPEPMLDGQPVRLGLDELVGLTRMLASRIATSQKLGHFDKCGVMVSTNEPSTAQERAKAKPADVASVVGQAGPSRADGRSAKYAGKKGRSRR